MPVSSIPARLITAQGAAPSYAARAWVNFNGTGTVAIRASGNVSSITDNGAGDYTANLTNPMPDADYAFSAIWAGTGVGSGPLGIRQLISKTTTAIRLFWTTAGGSNGDGEEMQIALYR